MSFRLQIKMSKPHGMGKLVFSDGSTYQGSESTMAFMLGCEPCALPVLGPPDMHAPDMHARVYPMCFPQCLRTTSAMARAPTTASRTAPAFSTKANGR